MLTWFISPQVAQAAAGDLDPTFGIGGMVMTDINRSTDIANAVAVQADGKLVVVGQTYKNNDFSGEDFVVAATIPMARSTPLSAAEAKCEQISPAWRRYPPSVVIQPDGKIVVAGGAFPLFTFSAISNWSATTRMDRSTGPLEAAAS